MMLSFYMFFFNVYFAQKDNIAKKSQLILMQMTLFSIGLQEILV